MTDDEYLDLLRAERSAPGPDAARSARVLARVSATVGVAIPAATATAAGATTAAGTAPTLASASATGASITAAAGGSAAGAGMGLIGKLFVVSAVVGAVGAGGLVLDRQVRRSPAAPLASAPPVASRADTSERERQPARMPPVELPAPDELPASVDTSPVELPAPVEPPAPVEVSAAGEPGDAPAVEKPAAPIRSAPVTRRRVSRAPDPVDAAPRPPTTSLRREGALLARARRALERGDVAGASAALTTHAGDFPDGLLAEEREALAVRVLIAGHRRDEARVRARRFHQRFPRSIHGPAVRAALDGGAADVAPPPRSSPEPGGIP